MNIIKPSALLLVTLLLAACTGEPLNNKPGSSSSSSSNSSSSSGANPPGPSADAVSLPAQLNAIEFTATNVTRGNAGGCGDPQSPVPAFTAAFPRQEICDVGTLESGEWLEYKLWHATAAQYDIGLELLIAKTTTEEVVLTLNGQEVARATYAPPYIFGARAKFGRYIIKDITFPEGESTLRIVSSGNMTAMRSLLIEQEIEQAASISGLTLIDTRTGEPVPGYEDIKPGRGIPIDLDAIGTDQMAFIPNANFATEEVTFNYFPANDAAFQMFDFLSASSTSSIRRPHINTSIRDDQYVPWRFLPSHYWIKVTPGVMGREDPSTPFGLRDELGEALDYYFNILKTDIQQSSTEVAMAALPGNTPSASMTIYNQGTRAGDFTLVSKPSWLKVSPEAGSVEADEQFEINLASENSCGSEESYNEGTFQIATVDGNLESVTVRASCSATSDFDLALERIQVVQVLPVLDTVMNIEPALPLIVGKETLVRAYVTASRDSNAMPEVVFHYRRPGSELASLNFEAPASLSTSTNEAELTSTFNLSLPKDFLSEQLEFYIEVDGQDAIVEAPLNNNRWPAVGYHNPNAQATSTFNAVIVPITLNSTPGPIDATQVENLLQYATSLYPVSNFQAELHEPLNVSAETIFDIADALRPISDSDTGRYYHALFDNSAINSGTAGIGALRGNIAVTSFVPQAGPSLSQSDMSTIAHEFGHNLSLGHEECGIATFNPDFPTVGAKIGEWGFDFFSDALVSPDTRDFMSYCDPSWVSRFSYDKMHRYWQQTNATNAFAQGIRRAAKTSAKTTIETHAKAPNKQRWLSFSHDGSGAISLDYAYESAAAHPHISNWRLDIYDLEQSLLSSTPVKSTRYWHNKRENLDTPIGDVTVGEIHLYRDNQLVWSKRFDFALDSDEPEIRVTENADGSTSVTWQDTSVRALSARDQDGALVGFAKRSPLILRHAARSLSFYVHTELDVSMSVKPKRTPQ